MYTDSAKKLLSTILATNRSTLREDRTRLLDDIKLVFGITAYLDPDTLWEASYLASRDFIPAAARVAAAMTSLTESFRITKAQPVSARKTIIRNTLLDIYPSSQVYATEVAKLIKKYPRRDHLSAQVYDVQADLSTLRDSLLTCVRAAYVMRNLPDLELRLFTGYFAERIKEWVTDAGESASDLDALEQLGAVYQLLLMSQSRLGVPTTKYTGICTLGETVPARIQIGSPVYAVPPGVTMNWKDDPDVAVPYTNWAIPAASPAEINLGNGCDWNGPVVTNVWVIALGINDAFQCRANNEIYTLTIPPGTYSTSALQAILLLGVTGALPRPFGFVKVGDDLIMRMYDFNVGPGMQLFSDGTGNFNLHCEAAEIGWRQGTYALDTLESTDAPTIVAETTYPVGTTPLAATLNVAGDITLATAQVGILPGDLIEVEYAATANTPLSAKYSILTFVGGTDIAVYPGLNSPADFATAGFIPLSAIGVAEPITVKISRVDNFIEATNYLDIAGQAEIGAAAATQYSLAYSITPAATPTIPVRIGDVVTYGSGSSDVLVATNPIRVASGILTDVTSVTISSGLGSSLGSLSMGSALAKMLGEGEPAILGKLHDLMAATTWTSFSAFSATAEPLLTDIADFATVLSGFQYSIKRLPWIVALLRQHGYDKAAASVQRGDILSFLPQSVMEASGTASVLSQLNDILNAL